MSGAELRAAAKSLTEQKSVTKEDLLVCIRTIHTTEVVRSCTFCPANDNIVCALDSSALSMSTGGLIHAFHISSGRKQVLDVDPEGTGARATAFLFDDMGFTLYAADTCGRIHRCVCDML